MREYVATAKTVEEAIQLGCEALSVDRDDLGVSYEICLLYTSDAADD